MSKGVRIYDLARKLDIPSREILDLLKTRGIEVKSHMSTVESDVVALISETFSKEKPAVIKKEEKVKTETPIGTPTHIPPRLRPRPRHRRMSETGPIPERAPQPIFQAAQAEQRKNETPEKRLVEDIQEKKLVAREPIQSPVREKRQFSRPVKKKEELSGVGQGAKSHIKHREEESPAKPVGTQKPDKKFTERFERRDVGDRELGKKKEVHFRPGFEPPFKDAAKKREKPFESPQKVKRAPAQRYMKTKRIDHFVEEEVEIPLDRLSRAPIKKYGKKPVNKMVTKPPEIVSLPVVEAVETLPKRLRIPEVIMVKELAEMMNIPSAQVIRHLMTMGIMANVNQVLETKAAMSIAEHFGVEVETLTVDEESVLKEDTGDPSMLKHRSPVVTIMGHVDHGKTTLLDAIRESKVAASEFGGITQHIGAYSVDVRGQKIVFLDTPGHEAFTAMRARGAKVTDAVILVVAADDGIMPQTIEAIDHARAAKVPIIVAINKIDLPGANPDRVMQELTKYGLTPEAWGGETICVHVSAKVRTNLDDLLEMILLQAEVLELKANPDCPARGVIIESLLDKGRGPVATVLVQHGTLRIGDPFVVGTQYGKVRAMLDAQGQRIEEAGPATPVEVLGLAGVPDAGELFVVVQSERKARQIAESRQQEQQKSEVAKTVRITLEELHQKIKEGEIRELRIVIKADVHGSVEAITDALERLSTEQVRLQVIHGGVGAINESDVMLAATSNAIILGFNVRPVVKAREMAEKEQIDLRLYSIIYQAIDDVKKAMEGLLKPTYKEVLLGQAQVQAVFMVSKVGNVAGCRVTNGKITRNAIVRLLRNNKEVFKGNLKSLRRIKDDVKEVLFGYECGMSLENYDDIKVGDVLEAYILEKVVMTLEGTVAKS